MSGNHGRPRYTRCLRGDNQCRRVVAAHTEKGLDRGFSAHLLMLSGTYQVQAVRGQTLS
jgi:hypothetical protein